MQCSRSGNSACTEMQNICIMQIVLLDMSDIKTQTSAARCLRVVKTHYMEITVNMGKWNGN